MEQFKQPKLKFKKQLENINFNTFGELVTLRDYGSNLVTSENHFEKAYFRAFLWHFVGYENYIKEKTGQDLSILEKGERYVEAILCLCQLNCWKEVKYLFLFPINTEESSSPPFHQQLILWGQYEQGIKLYNSLLSSLDNNTTFLCLNGLSFIYRELGKIETSLNYAHQLLDLAEAENNLIWEARILGSIGTIYGSQGIFDQAKDYLVKAQKITEQLNNIPEKIEILSNLYLNLGNIAGYQGDLETAIVYFNDYLKWSETTINPIAKAMALRNIGEAYERKNDLENAFFYTQQSLELSRQFDNKPGIIYSLGNLGSIHGKLSQYEQAIDYFQQEYDLAREISDQASIAHSLAGLGEVYSITRKDDLAYKNLTDALNIARSIQDNYMVLEILMTIADFETKTLDHDHAIIHWQEALNLAKQFNNIPLQNHCQEQINKLLKKTKQE
jgi:tetratricopeptide (TPR) repeat protein